MKEYIEREAVLAKGVPVDGYFSNMISAFDVANMPSADVAPVVHGRWIKKIESKQDFHTGEYWEEEYCSCPFCEKDSDWEHNFCPNCGARMDGD